MQSLFLLIDSLAKEEKRLYSLHGRENRFKHIYESYQQASEYDKNLDRRIYDQHYSEFSKAFYSMQKNALLDDILAVLLEYSNSSSPDFIVSRLKGKYEVILHKGFYDLAVDFIKNAAEIAKKAGRLREYLRILEDYVLALSESTKASWEEYEDIQAEIMATRAELGQGSTVELYMREMKILFTSARNNPEEIEKYKALAAEILGKMKVLAEEKFNPDTEEALFDCEVKYAKHFEDKYELHKRLVPLEKKVTQDKYPGAFRLHLLNTLIESSMEVGDFLLINGMIYKTERQFMEFKKEDLDEFMPRFLELCGMYYFYENDLPLCQQQFQKVLTIEGLDEETRIKNYYHLISAQIAANLARSARDKMQQFGQEFPAQKQEIKFKLIELVIAVEMNEREEANAQIQRLKTFLRKSPNPRKFAYIRRFLESVAKLIDRKDQTFEPIPALMTEWPELLKLNLWIKAKISNAFYYNEILQYWQRHKKVLNV